MSKQQVIRTVHKLKELLDDEEKMIGGMYRYGSNRWGGATVAGANTYLGGMRLGSLEPLTYIQYVKHHWIDYNVKNPYDVNGKLMKGVWKQAMIDASPDYRKYIDDKIKAGFGDTVCGNFVLDEVHHQREAADRAKARRLAKPKLKKTKAESLEDRRAKALAQALMDEPLEVGEGRRRRYRY